MSITYITQLIYAELFPPYLPVLLLVSSESFVDLFVCELNEKSIKHHPITRAIRTISGIEEFAIVAKKIE